MMTKSQFFKLLIVSVFSVVICSTARPATILYNPGTNTLTTPTPPDFFAGNPADNLFFEGPTDNSHQTTFAVTDPTADRTVTFGDLDLTFNQDVSSGAAPIFDGANFTGIPTGALPAEAALTDVPNTFTTDQRIEGSGGGSSGLELYAPDAFGSWLELGNTTAHWKFGLTGSEHFTINYNSVVGQDVFVIEKSAPAASLHVRANGDVGLNDPTPGAKLQVAGDVIINDELVLGTKSVTLTADNQTVSAAATTSTLLLSSDSATSTDRTAALANGTAAGQILHIHWMDTDAGEIADSGNCALSATWTPGQYDTLSLQWNGAVWAEISRSDN